LSEHNAHRRRAALFWIAVGICTSAGIAILGHGASQRTDWRWVLLIRAVVGVVLAWLLVRGTNARIGEGSRTPIVVLCGAAGVGVALYFYALARIPSADAMVLRGTSPLWATLGAWVILGQHISAGLWLGLAAGFGGLVLVQQPHLAHGNLGAIAAAGAGALMAVSHHTLRRLRHVPARLLVLMYSLVLLVVAAGVVGIGYESLSRHGLDDPVMLSMAIGTAVLGTIGSIALAKATALSTVHAVSASSYASIGLAATADVVWFNLTPEPIAWIGFALTIAPALVLVLQKGQRLHILRADIGERSPAETTPSAARIEEAIVAAENVTSCEIRVHVDGSGDGLSDERLESLFTELGVAGTRLRNGLLLAVAVRAGTVHLVVDIGIHEVSSARALRHIAATVAGGIERGSIEEGIEGGLDEAAARLARWFPVQADDVDELPNEVSFA
jgi:drug/metabolite transporter (DMT)-like permease